VGKFIGRRKKKAVKVIKPSVNKVVPTPEQLPFEHKRLKTIKLIKGSESCKGWSTFSNTSVVVDPTEDIFEQLQDKHPPRLDKIEEDDEEDLQLVNFTMTAEECHNAIKKIKSFTHAGQDGLSISVLQFWGTGY
jgi:hypothetical protein